MSFSFKEWFDKFKEEDVILEYYGGITPDLITKFLEDIEKRMDAKTDNNKVKRKVYNVLVECLQNLFHHSVEGSNVGLNGNDKFAAFLVVESDNGFRIDTGNYVLAKNVQILKDRMNQVNSLEKEELKSLYKLILNNQEFSDKGGGGLGMIDIAKRSGSKLGYKFHDVDSEYSFYHLIIEVS